MFERDTFSTARRGLLLALMIALPSWSEAGAQAPMADVVAAVRPALPFPGAGPDGELPAAGGAEARWFVVWPGPDDRQITIKANPLHPDTQRATVAAMARINAAVAAAERRAQAAYDDALKEVRRTGRSTNVEGITLDDEGVEGERIDGELVVTIEPASAARVELTSGRAPDVTAGDGGGPWIVSVPPHTYREGDDPQARERFRAAESRLYFGLPAAPTIVPGERPLTFIVTAPAAPGAHVVVLRGNAQLLATLVRDGEWARLAPR